MKDRPRARHHFFYAALDLDRIFARHPRLRPLWPRRQCVFVQHAQSLAAPFRQLIREVSMRLPLRSEGLRLAVDYVVIEASRLLDSQAARPVLPLHPAVESTKQILEQQFDQPWRLADLGKLTAVSPNHLVQLFTQQVGVSPHRYLVGQRIERAKELLAHSDVPITQLALDLGFSSSQHFAKTFRQIVRCSARRYRERQQKKTAAA
jgi:AraC-like DNA-binding protein